MSEFLDENPSNETQTAINAGLALGKPFEVNGTPLCLVPQGAELRELDHLALAPLRIEQIVMVDTVESFVTYYNGFAENQSIIFCDLAAARFVAVLDYHVDPDTPAWGKHLAVYTCPNTLEWSQWQRFNGKPLDQIEFATFIEDHLPDIVDPPGATMLEIAKTLHAVKGVNFRKAIRLDNGQNQLTYEEKIEGSAGEKGEFSIPSVFKIGVRLFDDGDAYAIEARLRYRLNEARLSLAYELVRPHKIHEDAVLGVMEKIRGAMAQGTLLRGKWRLPA